MLNTSGIIYSVRAFFSVSHFTGVSATSSRFTVVQYPNVVCPLSGVVSSTSLMTDSIVFTWKIAKYSQLEQMAAPGQSITSPTYFVKDQQRFAVTLTVHPITNAPERGCTPDDVRQWTAICVLLNSDGNKEDAYHVELAILDVNGKIFITRTCTRTECSRKGKNIWLTISSPASGGDPVTLETVVISRFLKAKLTFLMCWSTVFQVSCVG
jgi:hypothetical protein